MKYGVPLRSKMLQSRIIILNHLNHSLFFSPSYKHYNCRNEKLLQWTQYERGDTPYRKEQIMLKNTVLPPSKTGQWESKQLPALEMLYLKNKIVQSSVSFGETVSVGKKALTTWIATNKISTYFGGGGKQSLNSKSCQHWFSSTAKVSGSEPWFLKMYV